jgi:hypothetical protein
LIEAIADESAMEPIAARLKELRKEDRHASFFWFVPVQGYFYHKHRP